VGDRNRAIPQPALEGHHGRGAKAAERCDAVRLVDEALPGRAKGLRRRRRQRGPGCRKRIESGEGGRDDMLGRHRQLRRPHRHQQPGQLLGFVPELLANLGYSGRTAFRFERRYQIAQPRAQTDGVERFVLSQGREIVEEPMKAPQPARLDLHYALAGAAPVDGDLMIGKGIAELQQPQMQKAGDLDRAMRILDTRERRGFARRHPPRKMLEARERQVGEHQPVGAQFLQKADLFDLRFEARRPLARRHGAEPFETADPAIFDRRQKAWQPRLAVGHCDGDDSSEQHLLLVPPRRGKEAADVALAQQEITVIDEPGPRARHQLGIVEHRSGLAPQIGDEAARGMLARLRAAQRGEGGRLMVEQGAPPPVERPDRGQPRRCASELAAKMLQHAGRNDLDRIECPAGHLEKADLERERQPVQHPPPSPDSGVLLLAEREEMLDLDCRQGVGEPFSAEIAVLPSAHPRTLRNRP
jgi:hypothetical protein